MIEKSNKIIVAKLLLIPAIGNSLNAIYSVISRLGSIYGTKIQIICILSHKYLNLLSIACESSREFFIANTQTN